MNQIANVLYAYSPKNDDELELTVGDKIEVIGYEEEGWWKGRLKGRTGVFPSNFVEVVESSSVSHNSSKLNSLFGSLSITKNSISSNSLNNISNNSGNHLNNNNSTSNNNLIINNTQQQEIGSSNECPVISTSTEDSSSFHTTNNNSTTLSERRPKPLRGIGYGDIFAAGAKARPLPADPPMNSSNNKITAMASERLSTASLASNTLQKPVPKKPPPPAPADVSGTNGSSSDQAPALPPKPSNQFNPFLQQHQRPLPHVTQQRTVLERVQVIYAYKPSNSDELEMEVGDIIEVLDKNIEDQGWWRGELKGKIGVFPDNFVQPIGAPQQQQEIPAARSWQNSSRLSGSVVSNQSNNTSNSEGQNPPQTHPASPPESGTGRIKSVFAVTPKGFSKELESNLERHSNPGSFLSLKRNEGQQQVSSGLTKDVMPSSAKSNVDGTPAVFNMANSTQSNSNNHQNLTSTMTNDASPPRQNGFNTTNSPPNPLDSSSPGKLNHITATRAKGPTRRPPKNILNKRNQLNESTSSNESKRETPKLKDDVTSTASLIGFNQSTNSSNTNNTTSLPQNVAYPDVLSTLPATALDQPHQQHNVPSQVKNKSSPPQVTQAPPTTNSTPPPWMVELRKTNAEKKQNPSLQATTTNAGVVNTSAEESMTPSSVPSTPVAAVTTAPPTTDTSPVSKSTPVTPTALPLSARLNSAIAPQVASLAAPSQETSDSTTTAATQTKPDVILKQISNNVTKEINELKLEVKRLQQDFKGIEELKLAVEAMKVELRACQSATESQRKYIKDLVNNLADERKRIAAMQVEIDRNLK